jgi:regulator of sigma E protease
MLVLKIVLGLIGLGIVVFVHERGHVIAARLCGIDVIAFSIGWGKPLFRKTIRGVEYRIGVFPIGGYCKMRGENEFAEAWENREKVIPQARGTFFGEAPWKRIIVSFAGPFANFIFAAVVFACIWGAGFEMTTLGNRIALVSSVSPGELYPADSAGLETGDYIIEIDGNKIENYHDIQAGIAARADKETSLVVDRDGRKMAFTVTPSLDKSTGAGRIGVYCWVDPVVQRVETGSPAATAGLRSGDVITSVNGAATPYTALINTELAKTAASGAPVKIQYERNGQTLDTELYMKAAEEEGARLGIFWKTVQYRSPRYSFFGSIGKGIDEAWNTLTTSIYSLTLLFKGIDLTNAVSGPIRITYMAGEVAAESFSEGARTGFQQFFNFLSIISIALAVMNLLPLPILDGGLILLFLIEIIGRKPLHPRFVTAFQTVGIVLIGGLMIFAVFGDILFLVKR